MQVCNVSCCLVYLTTSIPVFSEKKMRTEENVLHNIKLRKWRSGKSKKLNDRKNDKKKS